MENREKIKAKIESMSINQLVDLFINNEKNEEQLNWYKEQLIILNKLRFSSKSEKHISGQLNLFNEAEEIADAPIQEEEAEPTKKAKKKKQREANFSKLPTQVIEHKLEDTACEICGAELNELAPQIIDVLKYQPARYTIERHIVHQYICPACTEENLEAEIFTAEGAPKRLIQGSVVSTSVVAGIVFNKYVSGTPLYRQEQELKRKKVEISRANMSNWLMKCGEMIEPLYDYMWKDLRKLEHVHMDETTLTVLEDKRLSNREKSYMWMGCSGKWEEHQMTLYFYNETREHHIAADIIGSEYDGIVQSDGYEAYQKLTKATNVGCMAHARRRFKEALDASPLRGKEAKLTGDALTEFKATNPRYANIMNCLEIIQGLFMFEQKYAEENLTSWEIYKRRQVDQKPILDEFFVTLEKHKDEYSKKSKMAEAIAYSLNQKEYLSNYLNDGRSELSNNLGERKIKPFVIGRKNWLFSNTRSGAHVSSIYYSLIESAKDNNLDIHAYLEYVLEEIKDKGKSVKYEELTPYYQHLPETLKTNMSKK